MKQRTYIKIVSTVVILLLGGITGCKKQDDWLDVKRTKTDVTPQTISDYQALLDNNAFINKHFANVGLLGADNIVVADVTFSSISQLERDGYLWQPSIWDSQSGVSSQWNYFYNIIEYSNIVLDGLSKVNPSEAGYNNVKGQALFYRAIAFYGLEQLFCKAYDSSNATATLGLPLRITSDVNVIYQRANLQQTFDMIIDDLKSSLQLLDEQSITNYRPTKYCSQALLSKVYLVMGSYQDAEDYASDVLSKHPGLLDFNSSLISLSSTYRFPADGINNPEVLFMASAQSYNTIRPFTSSTSSVASDLIASYDSNDLRKAAFYFLKGSSYTFRGGYTGSFKTFCGLATNELYLIRAECYARQGDAAKAMADINTLLLARYKTGTYTDRNAADADDALRIVLEERRKELPFTGNQRWEDLKRLNKESQFATTIARTINGTTYTLQPNSNAYALPIPQTEITQSGIQQNDK